MFEKREKGYMRWELMMTVACQGHGQHKCLSRRMVKGVVEDRGISVGGMDQERVAGMRPLERQGCKG
jgi:hypothetical protein